MNGLAAPGGVTSATRLEPMMAVKFTALTC
jgi:hypothetical protein